MSEDKIENHEDGKGISRRSRKDDQGRDYVCGCGKKYLSYPALYTHIKTKHQGNQPEGTQKTGLSLNKRFKQKIDQKLLKNIYTWVNQEDLKILTQLDQNARGCVPVSHRMRRQLIGKQLTQGYNNLLKIMPSEIILHKNSTLQIVLIIYLLGVGRFVSDQLFAYYGTFAKIFRNCYYQHLEQIYEACFKAEETVTRNISTDNCKMAPLVCDFFLRYYLPVETKDPEDYKSVMELLCYDFCKWMYDQRLSIVNVNLNKQYQISRKNIIEPKKKKQSHRKKADNSNIQNQDMQDENDISSDLSDNEPEQQIQVENEKQVSCSNQKKVSKRGRKRGEKKIKQVFERRSEMPESLREPSAELQNNEKQPEQQNERQLLKQILVQTIDNKENKENKEKQCKNIQQQFDNKNNKMEQQHNSVEKQVVDEDVNKQQCNKNEKQAKCEKQNQQIVQQNKNKIEEEQLNEIKPLQQQNNQKKQPQQQNEDPNIKQQIQQVGQLQSQ